MNFLMARGYFLAEKNLFPSLNGSAIVAPGVGTRESEILIEWGVSKA